MSYIFGGGTGETPESVKRKRAIAAALAGAIGSPTDIGTGLTALGAGIGAAMAGSRARKAEAAGLASRGEAMTGLYDPSAVASVAAALPPEGGPAVVAPPNEDPVSRVAAAMPDDPGAPVVVPTDAVRTPSMPDDPMQPPVPSVRPEPVPVAGPSPAEASIAAAMSQPVPTSVPGMLSVNELQERLQNPWLEEEDRKILSYMLEQQLEAASPKAQQEFVQNQQSMAKTQQDMQIARVNAAITAAKTPLELAKLEQELKNAGQTYDKGVMDMKKLEIDTKRAAAELAIVGKPTSVLEAEATLADPKLKKEIMDLSAASATKIQVGPDGTELPKLPDDMMYAIDPATNKVITEDFTLSNGRVVQRPVTIPIMGGKTDTAATATADQATGKLEDTGRKADIVFSSIDQIRELKKGEILPSTGTFSQAFSWLSSTNAGKVADLVGPLQSAVGLGALTRMKELAANGASGFGALTGPELKLLLDTMGTLDPTADASIFFPALRNVENQYKSIARKVVSQATPAQLKSWGLESLIEVAKQPFRTDADDAAFLNPKKGPGASSATTGPNTPPTTPGAPTASAGPPQAFIDANKALGTTDPAAIERLWKKSKQQDRWLKVGAP